MGCVRPGMVSVVFPGQGSQYAGMGKDIFASSPAAAQVFESAGETLGFPVADLCFNGPEEKLDLTQNCQPAVYTTGYACWAALKERLPEFAPGMLAGHSLGEFAALAAGASMSFEDGLRLVRQRGILMARAGEESGGSMCAVLGLGVEKVEQICRIHNVVPANINCPGQIVVSGEKSDVGRAAALAKNEGGKAIPLRVTGAFHSPFMEEAASGFGRELAAADIARPVIPVYSNVTAGPHGGEAEIRKSLVQQLSRPVRWQEEIERMGAGGSAIFIETGPGRVLSKLISRILPKASTFSIGDVKALDETADFLARKIYGRCE